MYMKTLCPEAVHPRGPAEKGYLIMVNRFHQHYSYCEGEIVMDVRVEVGVKVRVRVEERVR